MEIIVIGTTEFLPGFALAGIRNTVLASRETVQEQLKQHADAGIVILEEELAAELPQAKREELETSIKPVIIMLAKDPSSQTLRLKRAIINTLGVDLLK
jgi:V/A-type H+-transporting ATPase subunit F